MVQGQGFNSNIQNLFHATTKPSIRQTTQTVAGMIQLLSQMCRGQRTKWWPKRYLSFGCGRGKCNKFKGTCKEKESRTMIGIWCALANRMLLNNLDDDGKSVAQVEQPNICNTGERLAKEHDHGRRPFFMGKWDVKKGIWKTVKDYYWRTFCGTFWCKERCQMFCPCNENVLMGL